MRHFIQALDKTIFLGQTLGRLVSLRVGENLSFTNRVPANDAIDLGSIKESKAIKLASIMFKIFFLADE